MHFFINLVKDNKLLLLFYAIPWVFIMYYVDCYKTSRWIFVPLIVVYIILAFFTRRRENRLHIAIFGNFFSLFSSLLFTLILPFTEFEHRFKPFSSKSLIIFTALFMLVFHMILLWPRNYDYKK